MISAHPPDVTAEWLALEDAVSVYRAMRCADCADCLRDAAYAAADAADDYLAAVEQAAQG